MYGSGLDIYSDRGTLSEEGRPVLACLLREIFSLETPDKEASDEDVAMKWEGSRRTF
jgi:hypothetical protein